MQNSISSTLIRCDISKKVSLMKGNFASTLNVIFFLWTFQFQVHFEATCPVEKENVVYHPLKSQGQVAQSHQRASQSRAVATRKKKKKNGKKSSKKKSKGKNKKKKTKKKSKKGEKGIILMRCI